MLRYGMSSNFGYTTTKVGIFDTNLCALHEKCGESYDIFELLQQHSYVVALYVDALLRWEFQCFDVQHQLKAQHYVYIIQLSYPRYQHIKTPTVDERLIQRFKPSMDLMILMLAIIQSLTATSMHSFDEILARSSPFVKSFSALSSNRFSPFLLLTKI